MLQKGQSSNVLLGNNSGSTGLSARMGEVDEKRWAMVAARDIAADGQFWCCVRTTQIYCRPSCSARPFRKNVFFVDSRADAVAQGYRACKRCAPDRWVGGAIGERIEAIDWRLIGTRLEGKGWASLGALLSHEEANAVIADYGKDEAFRNTVSMNRHGFGSGEYRYYGEAVPELVGELRERLYEKLVPAAKIWSEQLGVEANWPSRHANFRKRCAVAGQNRPTPLILKYGPGDYNRLHRDLYGEVVFPYQVAILLSEPGKDFEGGEFVLNAQRPRMQSRAEVVPLRRGDAVVFAVNNFPVRGARGIYRSAMRHGVSTIHTGERYTLGIIFHDAV